MVRLKFIFLAEQPTTFAIGLCTTVPYQLSRVEIEQSTERQSFLEWETQCQELARRTSYSPTQKIPIGDVYALAAKTKERISESSDESCRQAYQDILVHLRKNAEDGKANYPPAERQALFNDTWQQILCSCAGVAKSALGMDGLASGHQISRKAMPFVYSMVRRRYSHYVRPRSTQGNGF